MSAEIGDVAHDRSEARSGYWTQVVGVDAIPFSPVSMLHVAIVERDGRWYIRLRVHKKCEEQVNGGTQTTWPAGNQGLLIPMERMGAMLFALRIAAQTMERTGLRRS